jgi:hypothetical protein
MQVKVTRNPIGPDMIIQQDRPGHNLARPFDGPHHPWLTNTDNRISKEYDAEFDQVVEVWKVDDSLQEI